MPELAEVEYYRKQWDCGLRRKISDVSLHAEKRIFRGADPASLKKMLPGSVLLRSESHGKQMLFRFSHDNWVGIHLGMTGHLRSEKLPFKPARHDHLVLWQSERALVFTDARQFGRVLFHHGRAEPSWWSELPPALHSKEFDLTLVTKFLQNHRRLPIKACLLLQSGFPGIGNWMADEILWRARIHPRTESGRLQGERLKRLWRTVRWVARAARRHVAHHFGDPPAGWLFHERWRQAGKCPLHQTPLARQTIGGRTTAWCPKCQHD